MVSLKLEKPEKSDEEKLEEEERKESKNKPEPTKVAVAPVPPVTTPDPLPPIINPNLVENRPTISTNHSPVEQPKEPIKTQPYYVRFKAGILGYSFYVKMNAKTGDVEDVVLGYPNGVNVGNGNVDWSRSSNAQLGPFVGSFSVGLSSTTICGGTGIAPLIAIVALQGCYEFKWTPEVN